MSRNGSGGYTPPSNSFNPAINGVAATAVDWNATLSDLATAIQQSISADGQTPITGNLAMGGNKLTGLAAGSGTGQSLRYEQLFSQGALTDIASAATVDIGAQLSNFLRVTGTTSITSFGTNYNGPRFLIFSGAVLLTHSATLVLPTAANITTSANDALIAVPIAGGWQVLTYQRADGSPLLSIAGMRNRLTNGAFSINQRVVTGTVILTAGQYGHDYWKAGASGCTYSFVTVNNLTTISIASGTLLQIIKGADVQSGVHALSWTGTAQGRVNSGAYGASGLTATLTGGSNTTVEFNTGTVTLAQLEQGANASAFEWRTDELQRCQRRYFKTYNQTVTPGTVSTLGALWGAAPATCNYFSLPVAFPVVMDGTPACTAYGPADGIAGRMTVDASWVACSVASIGERGATVHAANQSIIANSFTSAHLVAIAGL